MPNESGRAPGRIVAIVPAAGSGTRFEADLPKQYVELGGVCLLERALLTLLGVPGVDAAVVAIAPDDARFHALDIANDPRVASVVGAATRSASVAAALDHVRREHGDAAWALVHDAARPLVDARDVARLIGEVVSSDAVAGGILATRAVDTIKRERGDSRDIETTVPRDGLWLAQTPQLFRAGALHEALRAAEAAGAVPTDEASVMEGANRVSLVESTRPNPKITRPADLALARALMAETLRCA